MTPNLSLFFAHLLRILPPIRGRHRLERWWFRQARPAGNRIGRLPGGARLWCDLSIPYEAMVWLGREEWEDVSNLDTLLAPGAEFVDVGANIGLWSLAAASRVGRAGHVSAVEANPSTVKKLEANIALNGFASRISVLPFAASSRTGQVSFVCPDSHNVAHLAAPGERGPGVVAVASLPLDAAVPAAARIAGMKIDVEGAELEVLDGAAQLVERCHPWIVVEFNLDTTPASQLGDWTVHRWLSDRGYFARPMPSAAARHVGPDYRPTARRYANLLYRTADHPA